MALFKKKMTHQVTDGSCQNHLDVMRANYQENPVTSKKLHKPLWILLHKNDELNVVYRDKDIVFQNGKICYGAIVQANEMLYQSNNSVDLPANVLYSTHPIAEKYPEFLSRIASEIFFYKGRPENEVPEHLREVVRIITDELDRASVDFVLSMKNPENPSEIIENVDVHFCSVIVFRKDLPNQVLQGTHVPVIAAPDKTKAVLILPKEYWTMPFYDING